MHHAQAGSGGELDGKVAVAHGIEAVLADHGLAAGVHHATIQESSEATLALLNDILDFERIQRARSIWRISVSTCIA